MKFFEILDNHLLRSLPVKAKRLPTMYPSAASCRDSSDPSIIHGACMRQQWYRAMGYKESDPSGLYSQYIFAAGNMWEDWLTEQAKQMGIWVANSVKWSIPEYYLSGEIDILVKDPETEEPVILESKTYSSANYEAYKELVGGPIRGGGYRMPKPKVQNLMQTALYLHYFGQEDNGGVNKAILTYFDRACGGPDKNQEFVVSLVKDDFNNTLINVDTHDSKGEHVNYNYPGVTVEGVLNRYAELLNYLRENNENPPSPDYMHIYPDSVVNQKQQSGEISKTKYEKWLADKVKNPVGDWQCSYCSYKTICKKQKELDGHN